MSVIIRLQNLPLSANAANIRAFFQGLKIPDGGVNIVGGEDGDAFIAFATDDDARKAMLLNNQPINDVNVRLLLSSKQEMQSIITEAQNKVLKRSNMVIPSNTSTTQAQPEKRSYTLYNPQSKGFNDSFETNVSHKMRIIDYSANQNSNIKDSFPLNTNSNNILIDEPPRPSEFSYKSSKPSNLMDVPVINNINNKDIKSVYHYENYDYSYGNTYENYPPQNFDNEKSNYDCFRNNDYRNKYRNENFRNDIYRSDIYRNDNYRYDNYNHNNFNEEHVENYDEYYESNDYFINDQLNYRKSLLPTPIENTKSKKYMGTPPNRFHDYSERPAWLEESMTVSQSNVVRVTLPFPLISEQTILEIFKNIFISPKRGIRIELDCEKRQTGYVYVLFTNGVESMKALKLSGKPFRGTTLSIESMIDVDIDRVCDCAEMCAIQIETPFHLRSPYYKDLCIEIINVSTEVNEKDVKDFLNISLDNKRINFIDKVDHACCLINAFDERMMLKILSFNGAIFRFNSIKVIAISKQQLKAYLATGKTEIVTQNPLVAARKYLYESGKNVLSCAKFENLRNGITVNELSQLFSATVIPMNNIIINKSEAVVDFVSTATCQKIIKDLQLRSNDFIVTAITNSEFQSLKTKYLNIDSNGRNSVTTSVSKLPSTTSKQVLNNQEKTRVKIKNLPQTAGNPQIKELFREYKFQPLSIQICYANGRHIGEAVLTFSNAAEAVAFKDEYDGKTFLQRELEVVLFDRN